jgi:hypothetical protein
MKCRDLPQMQRMGRCLRLLKKMWKGKGRKVSFHFNVQPRNYPR